MPPKTLAWTLLLVFVSAAATQFLANGVDVFRTDLATWQIVINSGVTAVIAYIVTLVAPPAGRALKLLPPK
jgi:hypothetical protein